MTQIIVRQSRLGLHLGPDHHDRRARRRRHDGHRRGNARLRRLEVPSPPTITISAPPPALTHPVLYVSGNTGVYRSIDGGQTWSLYPASAATSMWAPQNGGYLPNVKVTNLDLSIGAVNSTTGANVTQPGDSNLLTATTDGQGVFAIRLGPMIFPNSATQPDPRPRSVELHRHCQRQRRHACGQPARRRVHRAVDVRQRRVRQPLRHVESERARC